MTSQPLLRGGIDLGGTKIASVVVDEDNRVLGSAREETPKSGGSGRVLDAAAATLAKALQTAGTPARGLRAVGMGSPGAVDAAKGTISHASNVTGFGSRVRAAEELRTRLGVPVFLGNDVGVAVDAEAALGAGRPFDSFLGVWWGTGVGGGVILQRRRWLGRGHAGEFGHTLVKKNGAKCPCGRKGCLEAYAGRLSMEERARKFAGWGRTTELFELMEKKGLTRLSSGIWAKAVEREDALALEILDRATEALALAMASAANLLDLDGIVLGGGLGARLGPIFKAKIEKRMHEQLFVPERPPRLVMSELGDDAGAIGAALLARQTA